MPSHARRCGGRCAAAGCYSRSTTPANAGNWPRLARPRSRTRRPLLEQVTDQTTGQVRPIKLVTDSGGAFKGQAFAAFLASRPELRHIRTRRHTPGQNGVRERAFGSLKYEHLYRLEIADLPSLAREAEAYRQIFNHIRPHEALGLNRPIEIHKTPTHKSPAKIENAQPSGQNS